MKQPSTDFRTDYDAAQAALAASDWTRAARLITRCAQSPLVTAEGRKKLRAAAARCRKAALPNHAGLVAIRTARTTGTKVGLYRSAEAGIETDPECGWSTVCEAHHQVVCHRTRSLAEAAMPAPDDWCDECRHEVHGRS